MQPSAAASIGIQVVRKYLLGGREPGSIGSAVREIIQMDPLLLILIGGLSLVSLAIVIAILRGKATQPLRIILALLLLAFMAFCSLSYLGSYELAEGGMAWRVGCGVAIGVSLYGVIRLLRVGSRES